MEWKNPAADSREIVFASIQKTYHSKTTPNPMNSKTANRMNRVITQPHITRPANRRIAVSPIKKGVSLQNLDSSIRL
jgi:hypothetical protein